MLRCTYTSGLMAYLAILAWAEPAVADPLADALAAHKAAVEMVDTLHVKFESNRERFASLGPPAERITGEYWRSRNAQRLSYSQPGLTQSIFILPDKVVVVGQSLKPKTSQPLLTASITPNAGFLAFSFNPWRDALFGLDSNRGIGSVWLGEHIDTFLAPAKYQMVDGHGLITSRNGAVTFRLDPKHNYLICRKVSRTEGVRNPANPQTPLMLRIEEEVREFQEVSRGIYFPKRVVINEWLGEVLQARRTVSFTAFRVNAPIDTSLFEPKYKEGTEVTDFIRSTKYKVSANGQTQGSEQELSLIGVRPDSSGEVSEPGKPTDREERRWGWWLAPAGLGLMLLGLSVIVWRRSRG